MFGIKVVSTLLGLFAGSASAQANELVSLGDLQWHYLYYIVFDVVLFALLWLILKVLWWMISMPNKKHTHNKYPHSQG